MVKLFDPYTFLDIIRKIFGDICVFFANLVNKMFDLFGAMADLDFINKFGNDILDRVYILVGVFVLFKAAIVVIRYVINPDELLDKKKGSQKFVMNILISLAMLTAAPTIFDQLFRIQGIVLNENVIGKLIFGSADNTENISDFGKTSTYYIFSSFIRYNNELEFEPIFGDCPDIFKELDTNYSTSTFNGYCGLDSYEYYRCATYLTKGANVSLDFSTDDYLNNFYYEKNLFLYDSRSNLVADSLNKYVSSISLENNEKNLKVKNVNYYGEFKITPSNSPDNYKHMKSKAFVGDFSIGFNTCNEHMINAGYCGVQNGIYLYWLIQRGRITKDVKLIYADEVLTARDKNYLLYQMKMANGGVALDDGDVNEDDPNGGACVCDATGKTRDADTCNKSAGGYVFDFDIFMPLIFGAIYLVVMLFLCIDVGIRAIKLAFLRVMSPIPIISYMDITESKIFGKWLKMFLNAYLDLFIKLACIYLAAFLCNILLDDNFYLGQMGDNSFAKIMFMIGIFFFAKKFPDFLSKMFNLGGDQGTITYMKKALSTLGTAAAIGAGGAVLSGGSNAVNAVKDIKTGEFANKLRNASGFRNKADLVLQKFGTVGAGMVSGGTRAIGSYLKNGGGKFSMNHVREGVSANNEARIENEELDSGRIRDGNRLLNRGWNQATDTVSRNINAWTGVVRDEDSLYQSNLVNSIKNIKSHDELKKDYENRVTAYNDAKKELDDHLYRSTSYDAIQEAFKSNGKSNPKSFVDQLEFKDYASYIAAHPGSLDVGTYNEFYKYFEDLYYAKLAKELNEKRQNIIR